MAGTAKNSGLKSADGITDLYGVMYTPFDMDSTRKYPLVVYVYPGPQEDQVPQAFLWMIMEIRLWHNWGYCDPYRIPGGSMFRGKNFYNFGYGNLRDYPLADCKLPLSNWPTVMPYIDRDRVGIYGHSGGGRWQQQQS